jgi:hypothetical protein
MGDRTVYLGRIKITRGYVMAEWPAPYLRHSGESRLFVEAAMKKNDRVWLALPCTIPHGTELLS